MIEPRRPSVIMGTTWAIALALLPGSALAGSELIPLVDALLVQPETYEGGTLVGPPASRGAWPFFGDIEAPHGSTMLAFSTGIADIAPLPGTDLGATGITGDQAGIVLTLRVPDDAGSLRVLYRGIAPVGDHARDEAQLIVLSNPALEDPILPVDPYLGGPLHSDSAAILGGSSDVLDGTAFAAPVGRASGWMEAVVPVVPGTQISFQAAVRDGGDDPLGDYLLLLDALRFDPGQPDGAIAGAAPRLLAVTPSELPIGFGGATLVVQGLGFSPDVIAELVDADGAAWPVSEQRWRSGERLELDVGEPPPGLHAVRLSWDGGSILWPDVVEVRRMRPTVTEVRPDTGPPEGGGLAVLEGDGFVGEVRVTVGGTEASQVAIRSTQRLEIVLPPGQPGDAAVQVFASGDFVEELGLYRYAEIAPEDAAESGPGPEIVIGCSQAGFAPPLLILGFARRRR